MHRHKGTISSLDQSSGDGLLSENNTIAGSMCFKAMHVDGQKSLCVGEPVSYDIVGKDTQEHAEHIRRSIGDLEVYQNFGGLYS